MRYLPHTAEEIAEMLAAIGEDSLDALFAQAIPEAARFGRTLDLPPALSEDELLTEMSRLAAANDPGILFLGGGLYDHVSPAAVDALIQRGEFLTAYTPYQPEVSQGTLQAIFEWQTLITQLTGMEVANASMYDGATATAEACTMARRVTGRRKILVSRAVHPQYRKVIKTYNAPSGGEIAIVDVGADGRTDLDALLAAIGEDAAAVVVQSPNFFGVVEDLPAIADATAGKGPLRVAAVAEALSLGLLTPPGQLGFDVVCGEAQSLGMPLNFGGPHAGFFATRSEHVRALPGRLVGQTVDTEGKRGYVLTLATREQHIRRDRATSNICTNQGLMALAGTIFMALLGRDGMRRIAALNLSKAEYAKAALAKVPGVTLPLSAPTFNEFVFQTKAPSGRLLDALAARGFIGGLDLGRWHSSMEGRVLTAVTERRTRAQIDAFVAAVADAVAEVG